MLDMQDIIKVDDNFKEHCKKIDCLQNGYNMICFLATHELIKEEKFEAFAKSNVI